jgi:hypothetical protein
VLIGLEWLPVVKGWALQSQKSQSLCGFQANLAFGTKWYEKDVILKGYASFILAGCG